MYTQEQFFIGGLILSLAPNVNKTIFVNIYSGLRLGTELDCYIGDLILSLSPAAMFHAASILKIPIGG